MADEYQQALWAAFHEVKKEGATSPRQQDLFELLIRGKLPDPNDPHEVPTRKVLRTPMPGRVERVSGEPRVETPPAARAFRASTDKLKKP